MANWFTGEGILWNKAQSNPYGAWNPNQIALSQQLGPAYQNMLNAGPSGFEYGGAMTAPINQNMQDVVNQSQQNYGQTNQMYNNLMQQSNPDQLNQWYNQYVQGPSQNNFAQNVAPYLREQAPGFGTQGEAIVGQAENTLQNNLQQGRLSALQQGQQTGLQAAGQQSANTQANMGIQQIPYEIQQAGLSNEYNNYLNSSQEYTGALNNMNQFLGLSSGTYNPASITPMAQIGMNVANMSLSAYGGMGGLGSGGGY